MKLLYTPYRLHLKVLVRYFKEERWWITLSGTYVAVSGWSKLGRKSGFDCAWKDTLKFQKIAEISKAFLISIEITHFFFLGVFYLWAAKSYLILRK